VTATGSIVVVVVTAGVVAIGAEGRTRCTGWCLLLLQMVTLALVG
jgi:hypothetical protein